jgi:hypothetical protein
MSQLLPLGLEILLRIRIGGHVARDALDLFDSRWF